MHRHIGALVLVTLFGQVSDERPFRPYTHANYAFVNAVAFSPDGTSLFHASFLDRVARHRGQTLAPGAPELGIFESRRGADGRWGAPALLPFSGRDKDYEPTLSPDGQFMIFNSWRPLPSGPPNREGRNNLWLSRRRAGGWSITRASHSGFSASHSIVSGAKPSTASGAIVSIQSLVHARSRPSWNTTSASRIWPVRGSTRLGPIA